MLSSKKLSGASVTLSFLIIATLHCGRASSDRVDPPLSDPSASQATPAIPDADSIIAIGLVRSDGILFPLAQLRDTIWSPLLGDDSTSSDTTRLSARARRLEHANWEAFSRTTRDSFRLVVDSVVTTYSGCTPLQGFRTSAPVQSYPEHTWPMPKAALALVGKGRIISAESVVRPYDLEAARVVRMIDSLMQSYERSGLDTIEQRFMRKISKADRDRVFDDEDRKASTSIDVLGVVEMPDRNVWVLQENGYESEGYGLFEFLPERPFRAVASVFAGGC